MIAWLKWLKKDREQIVTNLESLTNNREDGQKGVGRGDENWYSACGGAEKKFEK